MIRAVIFDFDGLILDTEVPEYQAWQEIFHDHGCELPFAVWAQCIGTTDAFNPFEYLEAQHGRAVDRDTITQWRRQRCVELLQHQSILPGVPEYIADAQRLGMHLGVASSSSRRWVTGHLERLELLAHFTCIKCADDVERTKPDPALYQTALDALGVPAAEAMALEDSPHGIAAAKQAGLFCVAVPNALTRQLALDQADVQLPSLTAMSLEQLIHQKGL
jgi:HAD superfamily hydrolase (TIGR01509 family)